MYKNNILILLFLISSSFSVNAQIDTNGNVIWLRSDSNIVESGGLVSEWRDNSTYNNHAYQTNSLWQPIKYDSIVSLNNKSVIRLDGVNDFLQITDNNSIDFLEGFTIFFLAKQNTATSFQGIIVKWDYDTQASWCIEAWETNNGLTTYITDAVSGSGVNTFTTLNTNFSQYNIFTIRYDGSQQSNSQLTHNINLTNVTGYYTGTIGSNLINSSANIKIGVFSGLSRFFNGDFAEIIIYNKALDDTQILNIEQYLHYKYAPPANLGYDINITYGFCDTTIDAGARFTDFIWGTGNTTQTITVNQPGQYSVTVTDIFGFQSFDSVMVYYNEPNQINDTAICLGDTIYWNTNFNHDYNFAWSTSSNDSIIAIYEAGDYYVQITDSFGCSFYTDTITVSIDSFPQLATLGGDTSLCAGNSISLNLPAQTFLWSTNDTTSSIILNNSDQYWLSASNNIGCQVTDTVNIVIQGYAPTPEFSNSITCIGDSTFFTDSSYVSDNSNIISWQWNFGDLNTSTNQNPTNLYITDSTYSVQLTIETDSGCFNSITQNIQVHSLPLANFGLPNLCSNTNLQFIDNSSSIDGNVTNWNWSFGNGDTSIAGNPVYSYNAAGTYTITLSVETEYGCKMFKSQNTEIKESPIAQFSYTNACFGENVYFTDNSIYDPVHPLINWNWDFGNGSSSTNANPNIVYNSVGIYQVEFVIQSLNSCSDTLIKNISINPNPIALFPDSIFCINNEYQLTDNSQISSGSITSWKWDLNSIIFTKQNPIYTFTETGNFDIQLIVISDSGCVDTTNKTVTVADLPDASFTVSPSYGIPLSQLYFTNNNNNDNFYWDFGNGTTYTGENPTYSYSDSGTYNITLIVSDSYGCIDSSSCKFSILLPDCDIAVLDVDKNIDGQYLSVSATIANFSNIPIEHFDLSLDVGKGYTIKETVDTTFYPGNIINYNFKGNFEINPNEIPELICVNAELTTCTDNNIENNEFCIMEDNTFNVYSIYPNPFSDDIYIELSIPAKGDIILQVYDNDGRLVNNYIFENNEKGFNRLKINTSTYAQGTYSIILKYADQSISKKMIKK